MHRALVIFLLGLAVTACSDDPVAEAAADAALLAQDPLIARALNDPLMSDPDLASRNEANAALGWADSAALPVFTATRADTSAARAALRLELLDDGPIPDLPPARKEAHGKPLGPMASAADLLAAVEAPQGCVAGLREDYAFAASLPAPAAIPRGAMVMQAGGSEAEGCRIRIVRYTTPAAPEDVLQYHHARSIRAGLRPRRYAAPEASIAATGRDQEALAVHVRSGLHGLASVDLVYRAP